MYMKADVILKNYWNDSAHFADLFNSVLFGGKTVIRKSDLQEKTPELSNIIPVKNQKDFFAVTKFRDVCMKYHKAGITLAILTLENQKNINYSMPVRNFLYDALTYYDQLKTLANKHSTDKDLSQDEYLSGMSKTDRLQPVLSIVLYYGKKPWKWPKTLHDLLDIPNDWKPLINNYTLHILEAGNNNICFHSKNNQDFFNLFKIIYNPTETIQQRKQDFILYGNNHHVQSDVLRSVAACSGYTISWNKKEKDEVTDMCDIFKREQEAGEAKQIVKIYQEMNQSSEFILNKLISELQVTKARAKRYLLQFGKTAL